MYGAMLLSLAMLVVFNKRIRARDVALVLVTTALSLQSARHIALFVAAATPVYHRPARARRAANERSGAAPAPNSGAHAVLECNRHCSSASRPCTLLMAGLGGVYVAWLVPKMRLQPYSLAYAQEFPVCAAQWLAGAPEPLKIFNQYGEGGYLSYTLSSHGDKVFIFGDAALMGDPLLYTYANVETVTPKWDFDHPRFGHRHRPVRRQHAACRRDGARGRLDQGLPGRSERRIRADRQGLDPAPARGAGVWPPGSVCGRAVQGGPDMRSAEPVKPPGPARDRDAERERRATAGPVAWIAAAAIVVLVLTVQPFSDADVWWHLALGRLITTSGIPAHEPFSFLPAAHAWVGQQWLYQVTLAGLVGAGARASHRW